MTKILVIDDSPEDTQILCQLCEQIPGTVTTTEATGSDGVARFAKWRADCVLLDYHLADNNGLSVLAALKARDPFVPVIVLSGRGSEELAAAAMKAGATRYLTKRGLSLDMLRTAVEASIRWMQHAAMMRQG
ncbi:MULTISPECIES: response regulator [unclassified Epibacterium]|jgi:CheY-like chemotaxis protein|uniref:response regulator n=1 Tax=unclassified Epibacterium TaxID=2639179 RepID=UPI001EF68819|nr:MULTISPECIES: response regulator [unclassified Epibacterium]MCG7622515.1 response regulator [Epibacterium sp. Ofav1-8]MCG7626707.1 response regulator [Epibacterium sp. MM17-32]